MFNIELEDPVSIVTSRQGPHPPPKIHHQKTKDSILKRLDLCKSSLLSLLYNVFVYPLCSAFCVNWTI